MTVRYVYSEAARPYSLIEWIAPAGTESPPVHVHHRTDEGFYVLDGTFGFLLDDQRFEAAAGSHVFVSRGHPHTFWNSGRELADGLAASESDDAVMAVRRRLSSRYDIEVVGPPIPAR